MEEKRKEKRKTKRKCEIENEKRRKNTTKCENYAKKTKISFFYVFTLKQCEN